MSPDAVAFSNAGEEPWPARYARLERQANQLARALELAREERDAYAAQLRDEGSARIDAEARLEAARDEIISAGEWLARIARRTK